MLKHSIIKLRRGTAAEWSASQPQPGGEVLKLGEPGYEKDTRKLKIGDGITPWNSLPYFNGGATIDPEDIEDILGDGFLVAGTGININYNDLANSLTISTSGVSLQGHNHTSSDITDFTSAVSGLLPITDIDGGSYIDISQSGTTFTVSATGLQPSGDYSVSGHTHTTSNITDFNSAVSGLLPVKDIVAGTGVTVSSSSGIYTINSSNSVNTDTKEPDGFINRSDSTMSFDDSSRIFTIAPTGTSYSIYNNGVKVVKSSSESVTLPDTTALYYIHFDKSNNNLSYKITAYNFTTDIPVAHIYYNADDNKAVYFGEERHGITMDSATHKYLHNVFGTQYINGLSISNYSISGNGSLDADATIAIGDGLIYDEDIDVNISHSDTPSNPFEQVLYPVAVIPVYYKVGSSGVWTDSTATNFPVKVGTTIQYNLNSAGTWSASNSDAPANNRFIASWICATSQENAPIIAIMGQRIDSSLEQATSNNSWGNLNLNGLPVVELRPLYRLIYDTKSSFTNGAKGFLVNVLDIRSHIDTITGLPQNDHGNLYGLADDDHYQYVHIDEARTIDAVHTFTNGLISNDNITVSGINVSLDGHQHVSTDITDFNSSVSGLLPTIANSGNNRILTSDGTSTGIVAESGLVFDGEQLTIRPNAVSSSGISPLVLYNDISYSGTVNQGPQIVLYSYASGNNIDTSSGGRLIFAKFRGTEQNPLPAQSGDCVFVIRGNTLDADNTSTGNVRIRADVVSPPVSGSQPYDSNRLYFNTSDGQSVVNNTLSLEDDGQVYTNGYLSINNVSRHSLVPNSSQQQSLGIYSTPSGNIGTSGNIYGSAVNFSPISPTENYSINYYSTLSNVFSEVRENVTNSGAIVGAQFGAWRNARGANVGGPWYNDNGTLSTLYGLSALYGHSIGQSGVLGPASTGVTPYTENAYGIVIAPQRGYGTINYAYDIYLLTDNYQVGTINNHYGIYQASNNPNYFAGSISVDNGLSAPTPVYSLGTVSGNTAINYAIDRQIQTLTLNGTSVNFTEGTGWNLANKSIDVVLQITVTSTTTVAFDSGFVTDWYSSLPTFSAGTYLILLRSIGSTVVQGHYIGKKL